MRADDLLICHHRQSQVAMFGAKRES